MIVSKVFSFCVRVTIALLIVSCFSISLFAEEKIDRPDIAQWEMKAAKDPLTSFEIGKKYLNYGEYKKALQWFKLSSDLGNPDGTYGVGIVYMDHLRKYPDAIKWLERADREGNKDAAYSLGTMYYKFLNDYKSAIKWLEAANDKQDEKASCALGVIYIERLNNKDESEKWFKLGSKNGESDCIKGLGILYHNEYNDKITAAAYYLGLINKYSKNEVLKVLRNTWKLTDEELRKAYDLHQTLDLPYHYTGGID